MVGSPPRRPPAITFAALMLAYAGAAFAAMALSHASLDTPPIWIANAIIVARLTLLERRRWPAALAACAVGGALIEWASGISWRVVGVTIAANLGEAAAAAAIVHRIDRRRWQQGHFGAVLRHITAVCVAAPVAGGILLAVGTALAHLAQPGLGLRDWIAGHGLGMLIAQPCIFLLMQKREPRADVPARPGDWRIPVVAVGIVTVAAAGAFAQTTMPLLFVPALVLTGSLFWIDMAGLSEMYIALIVISIGATLLGWGPVAAMPGDGAFRLGFLTLYIGLTVLATLPNARALQRRRRLFRRLRESEARYRLLADNSTDIIMSTDVMGQILFISPSVFQLAQHHPDEIIGSPALRLIAPQHRERVHDAHVAAITAPGQTGRVEFLGLPRDGDPRWFESHLRAVVDETGGVECVVSVVRDLSARKDIENALTTAALTDPLTGLPNRRSFRDSLDACIGTGYPSCVAIIDLDHFKQVNDAFGHAAGDAVLQHFALVARQGLRATDTLARIGGEEFALLLPGASLEVAKRICDRLIATLAHSVTEFAGQSIAVTTSIGLAPIASDGQAAVIEADRALYAAKAGGRARLAIAA